jgi:hypothetical protein
MNEWIIHTFMESLSGDPNLVEGLLLSRSSGNTLLANSVDDDVRRDVPRTAVHGDFGGGAKLAMAELEKEAARSITQHAATNVRSMKRLVGIIAGSRLYKFYHEGLTWWMGRGYDTRAFPKLTFTFSVCASQKIRELRINTYSYVIF